MKAYIHSCFTLSALESIKNGILSQIGNGDSKELIHADYKEIIPSASLRRMSKIIRMGVATSLLTKGEREVDGIIVGTGLGCVRDSIIFTKEYLNTSNTVFSPTAFIQSTENTIAGQIGLIFKNNCYNITYYHKGLAFENALVDAILLSEENQKNVLVGAVDEKVDYFEIEMDAVSSREKYWLGEGASFFLVNQKKEEALACIFCCGVIDVDESSREEKMALFLSKNNLEKPDLILYGNSFLSRNPMVGEIMGIKTFNYSDISGIYFTNSAFGMQLAAEIISNPALAEAKGLKANKILLVNNFDDADFGLAYLTA